MASDDGIELSRRKVLGGLTTIGVASAATGAGTMAYFSDTETSSDNTVAAGTLDLEISGSGTTAPVDVTNAAPGDSGSKVWELNNAGSIDGSSLTATVTDVTNSGDLGQYIDIEVGTDGDTDLGDGDETLLVDGDLTSKDGSSGTDSNGLGTSETKYLYVKWEFPDNGDQNDAQGDQVTFNIEATLEQ
ncbi:MAG: TasA family protein [Halobacteriaceae archaeon]